MRPYLLLHVLILAGWLLHVAVQHPCKHQQYWVRPSDTDNESCVCMHMSTSKGTSTTVNATKDIVHRCATLDQYAVCLSNGTCKWKTFAKDKCITLIFLPGKHVLTINLNVSKRVSLVMVKEPKHSGNVEIHLENVSMTLSCIAQLILADFSIINDNSEAQNNLTLMNVPHTCAKCSILKPSYVMHINNVNLSGSALDYKCTCCMGKVNLSNIWFNNSYAEITINNCPNLSIQIHSWYLFLDQSQTGLAFKSDSLQLKSVLIDSLETRDRTISLKKETRHAKSGPVYDLLFQSESVRHLDITIQNCRLERSESVGLLIKTIITHNHQFNISISNSTISNHKHGGIMINQPSVSTGKLNFAIEDCHVNYNHYDHAHYAAGLSVHSETFNTTTVTLKHTEFRGNTDGRSRPVVVYIARALRVLVESCNFTDNNGTAIQVNNVNDKCAPESFIFKGLVNFTRNSGYQGGALSLISAVISIMPNTTLLFEDNMATDVGGAIFVDANIPYNDETDPDTLVSCFYRFPMFSASKNYNISFSNNRATNGGNNIYGAPLNCYCTVFTGENGTVRSINPSVTALFNIDRNDHQSSISSTPYRVCLTDSDESIISACTNSSQIFNHEVNVYPGQEFSLEAVLVGFEFGQGTGTVNAQLLNYNHTEIWPERSRFQRIETPSKATLRYTLYSDDTSENVVLILTAEKRNDVDKNLEEEGFSLREAIDEFNLIGIISTDLLTTPVYINVGFKQQCPPGFKLRQHPNISTGCDTCKVTQSVYNGCYCLEHLDSVMECLFDSKHENGYLCLKEPVWVELKDNEMMYSKECPFDYCTANWRDVVVDTLTDPNTTLTQLCDENREGKLCGKCIDGYSLMLGSNRCDKCSNNYVALVAVFIVAGILLVIFMIVLNVTVAQGTINGLIFYANIVWAYNEIFFPRYDQMQFNFFKMFIAWINLDFGIEVCFFDGLNAYVKTWLQFVFPIYVWTIAGVIILLGRMPYLDRRLPKNSVQVLATLVLLSYSKLLRTAITALVPATIEIYNYGNENSTDIPVWKFDGEIEYGKYPHCMLLSVALLALIFLWIPYTFILLFISRTRHWSLIAKRKAFFDAYTGHLTPNCQFWVGLLLLVRCVLLLSLVFLRPDACVLSMVVIIILIFVLLYNTGSIYNSTMDISEFRCSQFLPKGFQLLSLLSMLDISFLLNLVFLGVAVLYADFEEKDKNDAATKAALTYASIGIVMIQFVGIVVHPRFKEYILNKYCIIRDTGDPEPEPVAPAPNLEPAHSSLRIPPTENEPLLNDVANNNAQ